MPRANLVAKQQMLLVASALLAVVSAYDSCSTLRNPEVSWNLRLRGAGSMRALDGTSTIRPGNRLHLARCMHAHLQAVYLADLRRGGSSRQLYLVCKLARLLQLRHRSLRGQSQRHRLCGMLVEPQVQHEEALLQHAPGSSVSALQSESAR